MAHYDLDKGSVDETAQLKKGDTFTIGNEHLQVSNKLNLYRKAEIPIIRWRAKHHNNIETVTVGDVAKSLMEIRRLQNKQRHYKAEAFWCKRRFKRNFPRVVSQIPYFDSILFNDEVVKHIQKTVPEGFWQQRRSKRLENYVHNKIRWAFIKCHHIVQGMRPGYLLYNTTGNRYTFIVKPYLPDGFQGVYHFSAPNDEAAKVEAVKCLFRPVKQNAA